MGSRHSETRVSSTHSHGIYEELIRIAEYVNFKGPTFNNRPVRKRNRDLSSVQAFLVELALDDPRIRMKLRSFMFGGGRNWTYQSMYDDRYFFDVFSDKAIEATVAEMQKPKLLGVPISPAKRKLP